ncbi:2-aminoethylphosphonate--pyruvate transaminase [Nitratidesulfovibrio sp.]|uniref:2-aminoethylphosphonate--pyruvate transaminase n=1 Tax=Nitratidesulfovibrio sp. TaxID=2802297 RepID=UPI00333E2095
MDCSGLPGNPYLLLTPGPLSTTPTVKATMLRDWCTWDDDYNAIVQDIRRRLVLLAGGGTGEGPELTATLMQGSGTFSVEAVIGSALPRGGRLLAVNNGAYGARIGTIARCLGIDCTMLDLPETVPADPARVDALLADDPSITHVAVVHCETTTGMLNPIREVGEAVRRHGRRYIVDAMSSFGGVPLRMADLGADYLISSANKCIQGVPGFGFVVGTRTAMLDCAGNARSLSLDLYGQWAEMEEQGGKWRFTSPTHVVRAFARALDELDAEGGVTARHARYRENQRILAEGMTGLGFRLLLDPAVQSPVITSFLYPEHPDFAFRRLYDALKARGFVIYPGKVSGAETFRIGNIGDVHPADMHRLVGELRESMYWK